MTRASVKKRQAMDATATKAVAAYTPTEREQRGVDAVRARKLARRPRPSLRVGNSNSEDISHDDPSTGWLLMTDSFGVDDHRLTTIFIHQLAELAQKDGKVEEAQLNANIALVQGIAPAQLR